MRRTAAVNRHYEEAERCRDRIAGLRAQLRGRFGISARDLKTGRIAPIQNWRYTTPSEDTALDIARAVGGDPSLAPEVGWNGSESYIWSGFSDGDTIEINLVEVNAVLEARDGANKIEYVSDGENLIYSKDREFFQAERIVKDPQAGMSLSERKSAYILGRKGARPAVEVFFTLPGNDELFHFRSNNWELYGQVKDSRFQQALGSGQSRAELLNKHFPARGRKAYNRPVLTLS